ncbi:hypothetical protein QUA42_27490, partial [Microcoleus sp. Pol11C2]|uniref:hypothetical protein n=1 Tax=Microcoleus sp. Pol11C2 TaxID=3055389 RepID=UPI002FD3BBDA
SIYLHTENYLGLFINIENHLGLLYKTILDATSPQTGATTRDCRYKTVYIEALRKSYNCHPERECCALREGLL